MTLSYLGQFKELADRMREQRDALMKALEQIEYASNKGSMTPAERLQDIRIILGRVGQALNPSEGK